MYYTDNPIADAERYSADQEEQLRKLPICCNCKEHIQQEDAVRIAGKWYCDGCLDDMREEIEI